MARARGTCKSIHVVHSRIRTRRLPMLKSITTASVSVLLQLQYRYVFGFKMCNKKDCTMNAVPSRHSYSRFTMSRTLPGWKRILLYDEVSRWTEHIAHVSHKRSATSGGIFVTCPKQVHAVYHILQRLVTIRADACLKSAWSTRLDRR